MKQFKAEDFSTGMKVVTHYGAEYIILIGCQNDYTGCDIKQNIAINPNKDSYNWTCELDRIAEEAVEVFIPAHPYDVFYHHYGWVSIWKKEEKSEQQKKVEELEATIAQAQTQLAQLKQQINKGE